MKNPYGLKDGKIVLVADVPSGRECECVCPVCGHPLEARKGDINQHHFAHSADSDCAFGYETALHIMAKEVLEEAKQVFLHHLRIMARKELWKAGTTAKFYEIIPVGRTVHFDEVVLEKMIGGIIPDVLMRRGDRRLLVEITVTHGIDSVKLARIKELNVSTVEFDFRGHGIVTRDDLKRELLFNRSRSARWAYHVDAERTQEQADQEYIEQWLTPAPPAPSPPPVNSGGQKSLFGDSQNQSYY